MELYNANRDDPTAIDVFEALGVPGPYSGPKSPPSPPSCAKGLYCKHQWSSVKPPLVQDDVSEMYYCDGLCFTSCRFAECSSRPEDGSSYCHKHKCERCSDFGFQIFRDRLYWIRCGKHSDRL